MATIKEKFEKVMEYTDAKQNLTFATQALKRLRRKVKASLVEVFILKLKKIAVAVSAKMPLPSALRLMLQE